MKLLRQIAFTALCIVANFASAQDLLVKKDGNVLQAKVKKVGTKEVE